MPCGEHLHNARQVFYKLARVEKKTCFFSFLIRLAPPPLTHYFLTSSCAIRNCRHYLKSPNGRQELRTTSRVFIFSVLYSPGTSLMILINICVAAYPISKMN